MPISNAVPANAVARTLGYALDFKDTQTASGAILPIKILVIVFGGQTMNGFKLLRATEEKVKAHNSDNFDTAVSLQVMKILDRLNAQNQIDLLIVSSVGDIEQTFRDALGDVWYNLIIVPYEGCEPLQVALKNVNGTPSESGGTGRWNALCVKPFVVVNPSKLTQTTPALSADDMTNIIAPAPLSTSSPAEIAASYAFLMYKQFSTKPHLDIAGQVLPYIDYPASLQIGDMGTYAGRENIVSMGISTVQLDAGMGGYVVQDLITGRRLSSQSDTAKDWRYVRDLFVDFNIAYNYQILQNKTLWGKVIVKDGEIIQSGKRGDVIYLSVWKAAVLNFLEQMVAMAYITDFEYSKGSLLVELSGTNPQRINTSFAYKRTGICRIGSTTAYAGFSFGMEA